MESIYSVSSKDHVKMPMTLSGTSLCMKKPSIAGRAGPKAMLDCDATIELTEITVLIGVKSPSTLSKHPMRDLGASDHACLRAWRSMLAAKLGVSSRLCASEAIWRAAAACLNVIPCSLMKAMNSSVAEAWM